MTRLTTRARLGAAALIAGVAMIGGGDAALGQEAEAAGTNLKVWTTDASPGGRGEFQAYGEVLRACDVQTDGYNVRTGIYYYGTWHFDEFAVDSTVNGACRKVDLDIAEGAYVKIQVCLESASTGSFKFCSPEKSGRA